MSQNKFLRFGVIVGVIALISCIVLFGTFAKYDSEGSGSDNARVAKWGLSYPSNTPLELFSDAYGVGGDPSGRGDDNIVQSDTEGKKVVAPGTQNIINLNLATFNGAPPEVAYKYICSMEVLTDPFDTIWELDNNPAFHWRIQLPTDNEEKTFKTFAEFKGWFESMSKSWVAPNTYPDGGHHQGANVCKLGWKWDFYVDDENDLRDTSTANATVADKLKEFKININLTAEQIQTETPFGKTQITFNAEGNGSVDHETATVPHHTQYTTTNENGNDYFILGQAGDSNATKVWAKPESDLYCLDYWKVGETHYGTGNVGEANALTVTAVFKENHIVYLPQQDGTLTYDGTTQQVTWKNFDSNKLKIEGIQEAKDAGTYEVIFTPINGYRWSDGSTDSRPQTWTIGHRAATITADDASKIYLDADPESFKVTISGVIDGDSITYTSVNRESGETVGSYKITPTGETSQGNYNVAFMDGAFTINRLDLSSDKVSMTIDKDSFEFDDTTSWAPDPSKTVVTYKNNKGVDVTVPAENYDVSYTDIDNNPVVSQQEIGTYHAVETAVENGNCEKSINKEFVVNGAVFEFCVESRNLFTDIFGVNTNDSPNTVHIKYGHDEFIADKDGVHDFHILRAEKIDKVQNLEWFEDGTAKENTLRYNVSKAVVDESFKDYYPHQYYSWLEEFWNLKNVEGLEYLNTSQIKADNPSNPDGFGHHGFRSMFTNCDSLTSLDISAFNDSEQYGETHTTKNCPSFWFMFNSCDKLETLKLGNFDTSNATTIETMFAFCPKLSMVNSDDAGTWNLECFDTKNCITAKSLCERSTSLKTFIGPGTKDNTTGFSNEGCACCYMFKECTGLINFSMEYCDVSNVKDFGEAFKGCTKLEIANFGLGIPGKGTSTELKCAFSDMFNGCGALTTIICAAGEKVIEGGELKFKETNWNRHVAANEQGQALDGGMFVGCSDKLKGPEGWKYDSRDPSANNSTYARQDKSFGGNSKGYFTSVTSLPSYRDKVIAECLAKYDPRTTGIDGNDFYITCADDTSRCIRTANDSTPVWDPLYGHSGASQKWRVHVTDEGYVWFTRVLNGSHQEGYVLDREAKDDQYKKGGGEVQLGWYNPAGSQYPLDYVHYYIMDQQEDGSFVFRAFNDVNLSLWRNASERHGDDSIKLGYLNADYLNKTWKLN